jgi:uncharacterized repeat protein (TIGR01451 family)
MVAKTEKAPRGRHFAAAVAALSVLVALSGTAATPTWAAAPFGGATVRVNQVTTNAQDETTIAVNPTNPRNLVAGSITYETGTGQCAAYSSMDRGKTWTQQVLPNAPPFTASGDPVVAFDANGTAYFLCMNLFPSGSAFRTQYVLRSTDGGQSWGAPVLALGSPSTDDDKGTMAVDDHPGSPFTGNVYVAATRGPCGPGELRFSRSTTGGAAFVPDQKVNDSAAIAFGGNIAVGADGAVYVSWGQLTPCGAGQSMNAIMVDKSTDGGQSFGALTGGTDHPIRIGDLLEGVRPEPNRGGSTAVLGTNPTDPNVVYAVWPEDPAGVDDSDVMFARSLDGGNTWSAPLRVNVDVNPAGEFFSQFWPTMAVDPSDGEIDIVWYSDQNDPNRTDTTPLVDLYFRSSSDGGTSFGPAMRVSSASSTMPTFQTFNFFGDYIGIDSYGGVAHPVWTDTTFGGPGDQNVATTQVGGADLRVSMTDSSDPAVAGRQLVYSIDVTNDGPADAFGVLVSDSLPPGVTYVDDTDSCAQGPGPAMLTCYLGDLRAGSSRAFDVRVATDEDLVFNAGGPVTLTNTASVDSDQDDPDSVNNTASESTLVKAVADAAIVSFAAAAPPAEVMIGQAVQVTLHKVITNRGPSSPVNVAVSRTATAPPGSTVTPTASSATASAVAKDELRTIDETFTITCGAPGPQTFTFTNAIHLLDPADLDPDTTNDAATAAVTVACVVPVAINIKPGGFPNALNLNGTAPVAVLTTRAGEYGLPLAFDASLIDPLSVRFGPAPLAVGGSTAIHGTGHLEDARELNEKTRDGDVDMVLQFRVGASGLTPASTEACVRGTFTAPGGAVHEFFGCDSVKVTP